MSQTVQKSFSKQDVSSIETSVAGLCEANGQQHKGKWLRHSKYIVPGVLLGFVLVKSQAASWIRVQEMFRLQSFSLYRVMGTAIGVGIISVWIIKRIDIKTVAGKPIIFSKKTFSKGQIYGGLLFGAGWALTGACPGPLFALLGGGALVLTAVLISAFAGTWVYGYFKDKLPH